ncbi:hypothetical protein MNBD_GAMMA26-374 [hydrothermal vent metagenome]|uniref:Integrase SAM-like N-terminal domain-containing protein n=1 Tax=hydrothermal vent metagenome TaxID=652676 RepID=A0A3B1BKF7_9ZZZZ
MPYQRSRVKSKYTPKPGKLLDQVRDVLRYHHYAIRTEKAYVSWILQFIRFNSTRHPKEMNKRGHPSFKWVRPSNNVILMPSMALQKNADTHHLYSRIACAKVGKTSI